MNQIDDFMLRPDGTAKVLQSVGVSEPDGRYPIRDHLWRRQHKLPAGLWPVYKITRD